MAATAATRIMVAVNESSLKGYPTPSISSRRAFNWTLRKLVRDNPSSFCILLLHVQVPGEDKRDKIRELHLLEYFVERCHQIGVPCEAWVKKGDPQDLILTNVKRVSPNLLVGSRGLGPFQKVFVGTVSEFCVKHAECPVVTIKRKPDEAPQDPADD